MNQREREQEQTIIDAELSQRRMDAFLDEYLRDRQTSGTVEKIFQRNAAFIRSADENESKSGFNVLIFKGPFVEQSNWVNYTTWEFAVGMERGILNHFEEKLRPVLSEGHTPRDWDSVLRDVNEMEISARASGYEPSLIVMTGPLSVEFQSAFDIRNLGVPHWQLSDDLRNTIWIKGTHHGMPILLSRESNDSSLYVADVRKFGKFVKYRPEADFQLTAFSDEEAREQLARTPDLVKSPEGSDDSLDEKVRVLRLRAWLRLFESYEIQVQDIRAVRRRTLDP